MNYSEETIVAAIKDYKNGLTYQEICKKHKINSIPTLSVWIRKSGVQRDNLVRKDWNSIREQLK